MIQTGKQMVLFLPLIFLLAMNTVVGDFRLRRFLPREEKKLPFSRALGDIDCNECEELAEEYLTNKKFDKCVKKCNEKDDPLTACPKKCEKKANKAEKKCIKYCKKNEILKESDCGIICRIGFASYGPKQDRVSGACAEAGYCSSDPPPPQNFDIAVYIPKSLKTCFTGTRSDGDCDGDDKVGHLYYDSTSVLNDPPDHCFEKDGFAIVKPEDATNSSICLDLQIENIPGIQSEIQEFRDRVYSSTAGVIDLELHYITIDELNSPLDAYYSSAWLRPTLELKDALYPKLDFVPDFNLLVSSIHDPKKEISIPPGACGLALGPGWGGIGGASYAWIPEVGTFTRLWFECATDAVFLHEWMHGFDDAYMKVSGFESRYGGYSGNPMPPCGEGPRDPLEYFPNAHECTTDPDYVSCGESQCDSSTKFHEHTLEVHFNPYFHLNASYCKNGIKDFEETGVDDGGQCRIGIDYVPFLDSDRRRAEGNGVVISGSEPVFVLPTPTADSEYGED